MKSKLVLPNGWQRLCGHSIFRSWNWTLIRMIANSGYFDVSTKTFPEVRVNGARNANWCMFEVEGKLVGLDTWDTFSPTEQHLSAGFYNPGRLLEKLDLLIKIQYFDHQFWRDFIAKTGKPVTAWTIFPCHHFQLGHFQWKPNDHKYIATCTGKMGRFGRQPWVDFCKANSDFYAKQNYNDTDGDSDYLTLMKQTRWGLSLKGKWSAVKNRRETEYSSCGMPLALNYEPTYPFKFKAGEDFVLLKEPKELALLRDIDPKPFAEASKHNYNEYFSPLGMSKTLVGLVNFHCR